MFARSQVNCLECRRTYVPLAKDIIRNWNREYLFEPDWLHDHEWAIDRVYQDNCKFCSPECLEKSHVRVIAFELERTRHKKYGKNR